MTMVELRVALAGLGSVGRTLLDVFRKKTEILKTRYQLQFKVVLIGDSSGVAVNESGFSYDEIIEFKKKGGKVKEMASYLANKTFTEALDSVKLDFVFESTPVNLKVIILILF